MGVNSWPQHAGLGIDVATAENARILIRMAQAIKRMLNLRRLDSFPEITGLRLAALPLSYLPSRHRMATNPNLKCFH